MSAFVALIICLYLFLLLTMKKEKKYDILYLWTINIKIKDGLKMPNFAER